ncbi:hypothetical protein [Cellulomonas sp. 73-92]|uniref:hypothetical protein n=1 Tax=Cellulomonas sp. 73-92 TaxID=1895740 RepID=UPI0025C1A3E5|nr:hypothetical protein [Cellulomonas sp. 73-92]
MRRDRARAADRARGGAAAGLAITVAIGAALWVRRLAQIGPRYSITGIVVGSCAAVLVGLAVATRLDLTAATNVLSRRLRIEHGVARRLHAVRGLVVLHDRAVAGSAPLSHILVGSGGVLVVVDASESRWAPWRPQAGRGPETASVWQAWIDASTASIALNATLAALESPPPVKAAVVTDVANLPGWAHRLPIYQLSELPAAMGISGAPRTRETHELVTLLAEVTTPAAP